MQWTGAPRRPTVPLSQSFGLFGRVALAKYVPATDAYRYGSSATMRYDLYFNDIRVGMVTEQDSDFPNLWGVIEYDASILNPTSEERIRLARFLELNRESIRLVDIEHEQDVANELNAVNQQLEAFNDFIESDSWLLIDEAGRTRPILVPIFRHDGEMMWRWNHHR